MSIEQRVKRLEEKNNPDELLNVVLLTPSQDEPLPEPEIRGSVKVSYRYYDESTGEPIL